MTVIHTESWFEGCFEHSQELEKMFAREWLTTY